MGRPKRVEPPAGQRDWYTNPARAPFPIHPVTGAPDPHGDLRLRGESLERVQADVERWKRYDPQYRRNADGQLERVWPVDEPDIRRE